MDKSKKESVLLLPGCVSCDIVAGKRTEPGGTIFENDYWHVGTMSASPVVWRGFLVIKLKRHCEHLAGLSSGEARSIGPLIQATCSALTDLLRPAKVYVSSYGDGVKHVHFWVLPRPPAVRPGIHSVLLNLDLRTALTRYMGIKKWNVSDSDVCELANQVRDYLCQLPPAAAK